MPAHSTPTSTLSLHDALPILVPNVNHVTFVETKSLAAGDTPEINVEAQNPVIDSAGAEHNVRMNIHGPVREMQIDLSTDDGLDRKSTRLNSSHPSISYAVFCL